MCIIVFAGNSDVVLPDKIVTMITGDVVNKNDV